MNDSITAPQRMSSGLKHDLRRRITLLVAVVSLTVPAAYLHGLVLHRWDDHSELEVYVDSLEQVPRQLGVWRYAAEGKPIPTGLQRQLELRGYLHRTYENSATGQRVSVLLLVGPSGPLIRHPPEICYRSRANRLLKSTPMRLDLGSSEAHLRLLAYESNSAADGNFLVAYSFGLDGGWDNPKSPRLAYAGKPVLFKLHAVSDAAGESSLENPGGMVDFLSQLLPALNQQLEIAQNRSLNTLPADAESDELSVR